MTTEGWDNVIGVCLTGAFYCTGESIQDHEGQGGGRILKSVRFRQAPRARQRPLRRAKFGIWGLTKATSLDGREFGIIASCCIRERGDRTRQESDKESDQEPMMAIETIAEAGLAMVSLPATSTSWKASSCPVTRTTSVAAESPTGG
ncbi:MAG: hypothetical protein CM1200mP2_36490 [Planctomycetaceae bacterium]|nr:MAG: hypothetical protein CM1200mP2_36490 [Planctomycetaceae bacterium]